MSNGFSKSSGPVNIGAADTLSDPQQIQRLAQLKAMLDDCDWSSAYGERADLRQALADLIAGAANDAHELDERTLRTLAIEAEDYQDFRAFREEWIRNEDAVPGTSPRAWLHARLRECDEAGRENLSRAQRYQGSFWSGNERFRVL